MLDVSLLQMKYAMEVYKAGSISQAARNLYMNQPNLSKAIRELESTLGIVIFIRTPKGILLSKEGSLFLEYAESIFKTMDELEDKLKKRQENNVSFNISIPRATYITYAFTKFVREMQSSAEMQINYRETNNTEAMDNILFHGFEMGIVRYTKPYEGEIMQLLGRKSLTYRDICESEYVLLMSENHPLAKAEKITLKDLEPFTELVHGDEDFQKVNPNGDSSKRICVYERGSQFDLLKNVTTTYMWVSPIPQVILEDNSLVQRRCSDNDVRFHDVLIFKADYQFSQCAVRFLDTLQQVQGEMNIC